MLISYYNMTFPCAQSKVQTEKGSGFGVEELKWPKES